MYICGNLNPSPPPSKTNPTRNPPIFIARISPPRSTASKEMSRARPLNANTLLYALPPASAHTHTLKISLFRYFDLRAAYTQLFFISYQHHNNNNNNYTHIDNNKEYCLAMSPCSTHQSVPFFFIRLRSTLSEKKMLVFAIRIHRIICGKHCFFD